MAKAAPVPAATSVRLPDGARPLRYDLRLAVDPRLDEFSGEARITIGVDRKLDRVVLHARAMQVTRATIDGVPVSVAPRFAFGGKEEPEELVLTPERALAIGEHAIELGYTAPFNRRLRGLYKIEQGGKAWAFTQLEAVDARRMFPGFDDPRFKTPFAIRVEAPDGVPAISNNPVLRKTSARGRTLWEYEPTPPLPTYLIALAVGELEITDGPRTPAPIRLVTVPAKKGLGGLALAATAAYTGVLAAYFDRPYPYAKLDIAAVPDFGPGAMENAGFITFREDILLMDPARAPVRARRRMESVVAHELAHQWFGNLVTMDFWDDLWLNEGFATWLAAKAVDTHNPEARNASELVRAKLNVMGSDVLAKARPVRVPITTSDAIFESGGWTAYVKGQALLTMLEAHVGEHVFRDALRAYLKEHAFGTVTSDDLVRALSAASGKQLEPIARSFLDRAGVPLIDAALECARGESKLRLEQRPLRALGQGAAPPEAEQPLWTIPFCVKADGLKEPRCGRLDARTAELTLPGCPRWIFPNQEVKGYFRSRQSGPALAKLAKLARQVLSESERAALVSDSWALVQAGLLAPGEAFTVLTNLDIAREPSRLVIEQVLDVLTAVHTTLIDDASAPRFRAFVSRLLSPLLARLGEEVRPNDSEEVRLLRLSLIAALFDLALDPRSVQFAERLVAAYFVDPSAVDPDLAALALRISARSRGLATPEKIRERLPRADPPERVALVGALGSSGDPAAIRGALADIASGALRAGDLRHLQTAAARRADSRAVYADWAIAHIDQLRVRSGPESIASLVAWACEPSARDRMTAVYRERLSHMDGTRRPFEEGLQVAELCIALRARYGAETARWLSKR